MKDKKNGSVVSCCWGYRHELLGLVLLVLATLLTIVTGNSLGIFAMFLVGAVLFCHRCWFWHCHTDTHCHSVEDGCGVEHMDKAPNVIKKTRGRKPKV